jgi:HAD superfamily hydrolase (TIGR01509 family)
MTSLKAILIDLDGTLADSMPALYNAYMIFMKSRGEKGTQEEFNCLIGPNIREVIAFLKPKYGWQESHESLFKEYSKTIKKKFSENLVLFPDAKEFLYYAKVKGLKLALVTSAESDVVHSFLKLNYIEKFFDVIITGDDVEKSKPDPEGYLKALDVLKIPHDEAWAIEDSPNGVLSALQAKIPTFQIIHSLQNSKIEGAKQVSNWGQIMELVSHYYE